MATDDLWYLKKRGPNGERLPSKRHGRGKRWRVRWVDPETGRERQTLFEKKVDADRQDANMHADISRGQYIDPRSGKVTVAEFAESWRRAQLHRDSTEQWTERAIRLHVVPVIGSLHLAAVRSSHIKNWVKDRTSHLSPNTLRTVYSGVIVPLFNTAVADRLIGGTPCLGIRLPELPDAKYTIATPEQVHGLFEALPKRYQAIVYVAAGCGWRGGEVFGLELDGVDFLPRELHVRHQLKTVGGRKPYLAPPKTKMSLRTNELPQVVANALAAHIKAFPPAGVEIDDETDERHPVRRTARLLFTNASGDPIQRASFSRIWQAAVAKAGLPKGYGLRDLRHYFATVLIFGGANVKTVQLAMGHATPTITLNTYVGYWPDAVDRTRSLVDAALGTSTAAIRDVEAQ